MSKIRATCPVFRVLIIGRANAGKTTILQKVCNVDKDTEPVVPGSYTLFQVSLSNRWRQRGRHDITNQITYPDSRFIFHDSRGIEAGSVDEFQIIHKFIRERASKTSLAEHLHAIWFCVSMDNTRPLVEAELAFFNEDTADVPVVVVFTKYDALLDRVANDLDIIDMTEQSQVDVDKEAEARYQERYHGRIMRTANPPKAVVRLQEMDKVETQCPELSEQTAVAIDDLSLRQLFVSVQQNNIYLCMQEAARQVHVLSYICYFVCS
ncbi:hypothetical protein CONPUDRAFT_62041 [Coniophora puteana RWD-64-598 SS2]|uniref:G domain-containing protein n=1 Tax=Coniophora puteana (strain RWD-64-598) TaxID=741705 RepID=A0A5M3MG55_CONPW|nr:uncharacterized protein CONPUDRAFT_62041 [Coniophora puteana RWD-64-598 SS2]EIW77595.1 hypothetical protein CONPUDRAFT_62041 [Coniophora puteana RWD-64-598 SS2]